MKVSQGSSLHRSRALPNTMNEDRRGSRTRLSLLMCAVLTRSGTLLKQRQRQVHTLALSCLLLIEEDCCTRACSCYCSVCGTLYLSPSLLDRPNTRTRLNSHRQAQAYWTVVQTRNDRHREIGESLDTDCAYDCRHTQQPATSLLRCVHSLYLASAPRRLSIYSCPSLVTTARTLGAVVTLTKKGFG